jgi:hypothetical protein
MNTLTIANQTFTPADIVTRFTAAQDSPETMGIQLAGDIGNLLRNTVTTFAHVVQATPVKLAAKNKARNILKLSTTNVMLSSSHATYQNAVKNSATKQGSDQQKVEDFKPQETWFTRDEKCAALAVSKKNGLPVLVYMIFPNPVNTGKRYYIDADTDQIMSIEDVTALMTPSEAKKVLEPSTVHHNKKHDIEHTVSTRAVYLHNVIKVIANKQTVDNY